MLRIITPATETRLTTAAAVRAEFGVPSAVVDATIETWIDRASAQIVSYCNRPFAAEVVREIVEPAGRRTIYFARRPVSDLVVTENGAELVLNTDYHIDTDAWAVIRLSGDREIPWRCGVQLDYTGGYALDAESRTLPYDVEYAAVLLCGVSYRGQSAGGGVLKAEEVEGVGRLEFYVPGASSSLPDPTAELLLKPYVVPGFA